MRAHSPSRRKRAASASVSSVSTTSPTSESPMRKSERFKIAFKSYFAPEDSQPTDLNSLTGGLRSSVVLAAPITTIHSRHSSLPINIPAYILNSVAVSVSGASATPRTSSSAVLHPPSSSNSQARYPLWQRAFDGLSEHEQQTLNFEGSDKLGTLQMIMDMTKEKRNICIEKQWKLSYNGKTIILRDVADKLLFWVEKFQQIGNFAVQFDTAHAGLPWEAFKFLLQVIGGDNVKMGSILVALERIAVLMDRCAIYEGLYLESGNQILVFKNLEKELTKLYTTILQALAKAKKFYEQNTAIRMATSIFDVGGVQLLLDEMGSREIEVNKAASQAEATCRRFQHQETTIELQNLHDILRDIEYPILRIDSNVSELQRSFEDSKRNEILKWISKVTYKQHHDKACKGRVENTGYWFLETDEFKEWRKSSTSAMLWLRGASGTGKTKLTSLVVDALLSDLNMRNSSEGFAYFYCNRNKRKRRDPDSIFRAILKQLSYRADAYSIHQLVIREYDRRKRDAFSSGGMVLQESKKLIMELLSTCPQTTIIIDALDECDLVEREGLFDALKDIAASSNLVKIFVSSRDEPDIIRSFKGVPNFLIKSTENAKDIHRFVEFSVRQKIESQKLIGGNVNEALEELICSTLKQNSDGTFLSAQKQIEAMCGCNVNTEEEVKEILSGRPYLE